MKKVEWRYHRQNCLTCQKSQSYLEKNGLQVMNELDARKNRIGSAEALNLLCKIDRLYVSKGKQFVQIDLKKNRPDDDSLTKMVLGPTGNLRAPTIKIGKTLLVGFNEEMYSKNL
jgi:arsenate reductase-like glutaredoxin family protein